MHSYDGRAGNMPFKQL